MATHAYAFGITHYLLSDIKYKHYIHDCSNAKMFNYIVPWNTI